LRFFKLRNFERFAIKEGIPDEALKEVVAQMEAGQINAAWAAWYTSSG
jgi:hypothetical protein